MKKVRVTYKNPVDKKTGQMYMNEKTLKWYRSPEGKKFSPYKRITVLKKQIKKIDK